MPQGLSKIKQIAHEAKERQKAFDEAGPGVRFFGLGDEETASVRFLEQGDDVWYVWVHELPKKQGQRFGDQVMCLDQDDKGEPCPACARNIGRTARVAINLIWYDAPKFQREPAKEAGKLGKILKDSNNRPLFEMTQGPDGSPVRVTEVVTAVWNTSQTVGGRLAYLDSENGGLTGCVCKIMRQGTDKNTKWNIDVKEQRDPDATDHKFYTEKGDPRAAIRSLTWRDMEQAYSGGAVPVGSTGLPSSAPAGGESNSFAAAAQGGAINRGAFGG